jgi:hypothetical protein
MIYVLIGPFWIWIGAQMLYGVIRWYDDPEVFILVAVGVAVMGSYLLYSGVSQLLELAWQLFGREEFEIVSGRLIYRRPLGPWKRAREYDLSRVRNLRDTSLKEGLEGFLSNSRAPGSIAFDYGAETCWIASGFSARETREVLDWLREGSGDSAQR